MKLPTVNQYQLLYDTRNNELIVIWLPIYPEISPWCLWYSEDKDGINDFISTREKYSGKDFIVIDESISW